jgi:phytoene dehydrogenase-like protein
VRSAELTLPGFVHDVCSAIHPLAIGSPFFRTLPLAQYGLEWVQPEFPLAHPLDDRTAVVLKRSVKETSRGLGADEAAYQALMGPLTAHWTSLAGELLRPMLRLPRHPLQLARFGARALHSANGIAQSWFRGERAKALFGAAAIFPVMLHSTLAPENSLTAYAVASSSTTLLRASFWWPIGFALAVFYFVFISRRYAGKVSVQRDTQGFY